MFKTFILIICLLLGQVSLAGKNTQEKRNLAGEVVSQESQDSTSKMNIPASEFVNKYKAGIEAIFEALKSDVFIEELRIEDVRDGKQATSQTNLKKHKKQELKRASSELRYALDYFLNKKVSQEVINLMFKRWTNYSSEEKRVILESFKQFELADSNLKHYSQFDKENKKINQEIKNEFEEVLKLSAEEIRGFVTDFVEEARFFSDLTPKKIKAVNLFSEILLNEGPVKHKDIQKFRKVLGYLNLPTQRHFDQHIQMSLAAMKEQISEDRKAQLRSANINHEKALELLLQIKYEFDEATFNNLKEARKFIRTLKGYPAQYIIFQAAIGATMFRQSVSDTAFYGAQKNPETFSQFSEQLIHPSSIVSFFIFVLVSGQASYYTYSGGRYFDSKFLRSIAPSVGLASGFFISTLFQEAWQDVDLWNCAKTYTSANSREEESRLHVGSCQKAYLNWVSGKWSHYGTDITLMIASSLSASKVMNTSLFLIRSSSVTSSLLSRSMLLLGSRVVPWVSFFVHIYLFMEIHQIYEKYIGKHVKNKLDVISITKYIKTLLAENENAGEHSNRSSLIENHIHMIKKLGYKFEKRLTNSTYEYQMTFHGWQQQINKVTLTYQQSENLLRQLYESSQSSHEFTPSHHQGAGFFVDQYSYERDQENSTNIDNEANPHFHHSLYFRHALCATYKDRKSEFQLVHSYFCERNTDIDWASDAFLKDFASLMLIERRFKGEVIEDISLYISEKDDELFSYQGSSKNLTELRKESSKNKKIVNSFLKGFVDSASKQNPNYKLLAAALYLLKKPDSYHHDGNITYSISNYLKIYNKGESFFADKEFVMNSLNYYFSDQIQHNKEIETLSNYNVNFFREAVCGVQTDKSHFNSPKLFGEEFNAFCDEHKKDWDMDLLFSKPVTVYKKEYKNLWLALEAEVAARFDSEISLINYFRKISKGEVDRLTEQTFAQLDVINHDFLIPNMINKDVGHIKTCDQIVEYYFADGLADSSSKLSKYKGLEATLFQTIFWFKYLEGISDFKFEDVCSTLELLKSYHDKYISAEESSIRPMNQQEILKTGLVSNMYFENQLCLNNNFEGCTAQEECSSGDIDTCISTCLENKCFSEDVITDNLSLLMNHISGSLTLSEQEVEQSLQDPCLFEAFQDGDIFKCLDTKNKSVPLISGQQLLVHILKDSHFKYITLMDLMNANLKPNNSVDYLQYSVIFEINKNIQSYFTQLNVLRIKESAEQKLNQKHGASL